MMVDLRRFTECTDGSKVERIGQILQWFRGTVIDAANNNKGVIDKFVGDGAMVIFGLHGTAQESVQNAFSAYEEISQNIENWNAQIGSKENPMEIATAIHSGSVLIGAFGDERQLSLVFKLCGSYDFFGIVAVYAKTIVR